MSAMKAFDLGDRVAFEAPGHTTGLMRVAGGGCRAR